MSGNVRRVRRVARRRSSASPSMSMAPACRSGGNRAPRHPLHRPLRHAARRSPLSRHARSQWRAGDLLRLSPRRQALSGRDLFHWRGRTRDRRTWQPARERGLGQREPELLEKTPPHPDGSHLPNSPGPSHCSDKAPWMQAPRFDHPDYRRAAERKEPAARGWRRAPWFQG